MDPPSLVRTRDVAEAWWPLALSWLLMAAEQPAVAAIVARLADPELALAAYGSVVFPIALVIEAPIISLLSASTELSRDRASYRSLRRFTDRSGAILTVLHLIVTATPVFDLIVRGLFGVPESVASQARVGLWIMLPWTWAIASRRMGQGVLIRYGLGRWVMLGTAFRLGVSAAVLWWGYAWDGPGVVVATAALTSGVLAEAAFVAWCVQRLALPRLPSPEPAPPVLAGRDFWAFYVPLALMPLVSLVIQPVGTAALSRMPLVLESLALWPVLIGILFVFQSVGMSFSEVVVALLGRPGAERAIRRFIVWLVAGTLVGPLVLATTPLTEVWFGVVTGLDEELTRLATFAFILGIPVPVFRTLQSWYQGVLVVRRRTRGITEAIVVFAVVCIAVLLTGVATSDAPGIYWGVAGFTLGRLAETMWLAFRVRRDGAPRGEAMQASGG